VSTPNASLALDQDLVANLTMAVTETFEAYFNMNMKCLGSQRLHRPPLQGEIGSVISITSGAPLGKLIIGFPVKTIQEALKGIYERELQADEPALQDGSNEVANTVFGLFKMQASKRGYQFDMVLPQPAPVNKQGQMMISTNETLVLSFSDAKHTCWVALSTN
jgi:CheY-specific phosphatase CheX